VLKPHAQPLLRQRGFSLVEVVVTIALLALLLGLAAPAFGTWTRNAQVRTVSDSLQTGLRFAQAEAVRRHRQVAFFRTENRDCTNAITSSDNGNFWSIRTVPLVAGEIPETLQCGVLNDVAGGVTIAGPRVLCFNSAGRMAANANNVVGDQTCIAPALQRVYTVSAPGAERILNVNVTLGGQVRMCLVGSTGLDAC
jgi:type IV fimbrial biogenesis protein FimT